MRDIVVIALLACAAIYFLVIPGAPITPDIEASGPVSAGISSAPIQTDSTGVAANQTPSPLSMPLPVTADAKQETFEPLTAIARIQSIQNKSDLHESILSDHTQFKRYPSYNRRFENPSKDPTAKRYDKDIRTTREENTELALTIWSNQKYYVHGDQVTVFAMLEDPSGDRVNSQFAAQLIFNETDSLQALTFDDPDQDKIFETSFTFTETERSFQAGIYKVLVANDQNHLIDSAVFVLSEPDAALTGNYRDRLTPEGDLLIEAELEVSLDSRFSIEASLYSSTNDPIGQSQHAVSLGKGKHWIPITFDGQLFHDAQEPGPYHLKHLSLAKVAMPLQRAPLVQTPYHTYGYTVDQFKTASAKD